MSLHVRIVQIMSSFWNLSSSLCRALPGLPVIRVCVFFYTEHAAPSRASVCCGCRCRYCLLPFLTSTRWKVKVKGAQSCLTLCDPMYYTVHGILQSRILECLAVPFSRGSSQLRDRTQVSRIAGGFFTTDPPGKPLLPVMSYSHFDRQKRKNTTMYSEMSLRAFWYSFWEPLF